MTGQTLAEQEPKVVMQQVTKADCLSIDDAAAELKTSRTTVYAYMNILQVQRYRFFKDKRTYIAKVDVERIKQKMQEE